MLIEMYKIYLLILYLQFFFDRCWQKTPEERPSMDEVVRIMTELSEFFSRHLEPVEYCLSM